MIYEYNFMLFHHKVSFKCTSFINLGQVDRHFIRWHKEWNVITDFFTGNKIRQIFDRKSFHNFISYSITLLLSFYFLFLRHSHFYSSQFIYFFTYFLNFFFFTQLAHFDLFSYLNHSQLPSTGFVMLFRIGMGVGLKITNLLFRKMPLIYHCILDTPFNIFFWQLHPAPLH